MKTWFITGANRGLGLEIARAALNSGDQVVAGGRSAQAVARALDRSERLLVVPLDVTDSAGALQAVKQARQRFGRVDVLVNNAGYGQLGAFEEVSQSAVEKQFATNLFGAFNVTRAVLPVMRSQRSGHIIVISSMSGVAGCARASIYCASKFALTGWADSLAMEVAPLGIAVTALYPGTFRTGFFDSNSVHLADLTVDDYRGLEADSQEGESRRAYTEVGDPVAFGSLVVEVVNMDKPPTHLAVGSDANAVFKDRARSLHGTAAKWEKLSKSTDFAISRFQPLK